MTVVPPGWYPQGDDMQWWDGLQWGPRAVRTPVATAPEPAPVASRDHMVTAWLSIAGAVVVVVGVFLPWATLSDTFVSLSRNGMQLGTRGGTTFLQGPVCLILAVIAALIGITYLVRAKSAPKHLRLACILVAFGIGAVLAAEYWNLQDNTFAPAAAAHVIGTISDGFWIVAGGGAMVLLAGLDFRKAVSPAAR